MVVIIVERCLVNNLEVNPGHVVNLLFLMTLMKVWGKVPKQATCRYKTVFVFVSFLIITESECSGIGYNTVKS